MRLRTIAGDRCQHSDVLKLGALLDHDEADTPVIQVAARRQACKTTDDSTTTKISYPGLALDSLPVYESWQSLIGLPGPISPPPKIASIVRGPSERSTLQLRGDENGLYLLGSCRFGKVLQLP